VLRSFYKEAEIDVSSQRNYAVMRFAYRHNLHAKHSTCCLGRISRYYRAC